MGFQQGLSGLSASAKYLDVLGNNIANVSTTGFKSSRVEFGDVYASAVGGASRLQAGIGVSTTLVSQKFDQGSVTVTGNNLDVAISGGGFFKLQKTDGTLAYTRNGQFKLDKDGFLVTSTGDNIWGYTNNVAGMVQLNLDDVNATATTAITLTLNLNSGDITPKIVPLDTTDPESYNYNTSLTVYDSLGTGHVLSNYFVKDAVSANQWKVYSYLDSGVTQPSSSSVDNNIAISNSGDASLSTSVSGAIPSGSGGEYSVVWDGAEYSLSGPMVYDAAVPGYVLGTPSINLTGFTDIDALNTAIDQVDFNGDGNLGMGFHFASSGTPVANDTWYVSINSATHDLTFTTSGALVPSTSQMAISNFAVYGADNINLDMDWGSTTQYDGKSGVNTISADGQPSGKLVGVYISDEGKVMGRYSNGVESEQAVLTLTSFRNPNGLVPIGNNQWTATVDAGAVTENTPGTGVAGRLQSGAIEDSNTDLTSELVNLIVAQRIYQANAQTIRAQDQVLQTLVNMR